MSEADFHKLVDTNPNLHKDVLTGKLPEANADFVAVANAYPRHEDE